jgi:hypothetical protein
MHHRHKLSISARVTAVRAEFARSKSRHEGSGTATAFDSTVAISGVRSDELVWVAAEVYAGLADEV